MKKSIKNILNWILWITGLVAVAVLIYGIIRLIVK